MCRRNHSNVHRAGGRGAHFFDLTSLDEAKKFDPKLHGHLPDLVEKQRPTIRRFHFFLFCA